MTLNNKLHSKFNPYIFHSFISFELSIYLVFIVPNLKYIHATFMMLWPFEFMLVPRCSTGWSVAKLILGSVCPMSCSQRKCIVFISFDINSYICQVFYCLYWNDIEMVLFINLRFAYVFGWYLSDIKWSTWCSRGTPSSVYFQSQVLYWPGINPTSIDIHRHGGGPPITILFHSRRVSYLSSYSNVIKYVILNMLYCIVLCSLNKINRVRITITVGLRTCIFFQYMC